MAELTDEERLRRIAARIAASLPDLFPRQPNYRYFSHKGWEYCWTTERMPDGKFAAFVYKPVGKDGTLKLVKERRFKARKTAKAYAMKWHQAAKKKG